MAICDNLILGKNILKFMFSKKAIKFDEIFTVNCKCQIDGEDFVNFCGLFGKHELFTKIVQICIHSIALIFSSGCVLFGAKIWEPYFNSKRRIN